mmetsp:Transcript_16124/g.34854  ORF Transcript_16124/g.34854 Transcript_16124/m.34854 type:complete len:263 (-) Transcript_16124:1194-1982(-)
MGDDVHHLLQVGQDSAAHEDGNLLHDLDTSVSRLPTLLGLAHSPQEQEQGWDAQSRSHHSEGSGCCVSHVLIRMIDIRSHSGDHGGQTSSLGEVADDFSALNSGKVVLIDQKGLDDHEDLVDIRPHHVVELVQNSVNDLDEQVSLLILQSTAHEQGKDLVEEGSRPEAASSVRDLSQGRTSHGRGAVLHLQQQPHDLPLLRFLGRQVVVVSTRKKRCEVGVVLGFDHRHFAHRGGGWHLEGLGRIGVLHAEKWGATWSRCRG